MQSRYRMLSGRRFLQRHGVLLTSILLPKDRPLLAQRSRYDTRYWERQMMLIDAAELTATTHRVFAAAGSAEAEAEIVADHLIEANLKGHDSHGVGMIPSYLRNLGGGKVKPNEPGRIVSDTGSLLVYDGERGYGQIVARAATELAIERAQANGVAVVALRNAHHIGRVGTYGELCAAAGLVSLHFVNITDQP